MRRPKLLLINADSNWGSTGHITEQLGGLARQDGWEVHVVYGREHNLSELNEHRFTSKRDVYEHYIEHRLFDNDGRASRQATRRMVDFVERLQPDLIHLHNIHDHWLNYRLLLGYLVTKETPVVWTQHDCWSFTGGCGHYTMTECDQWETTCTECPLKHGLLPLHEKTASHYEEKKRLINSIRNLTLVPVSRWLEGEIRKSFLNGKKIVQIYNGVDIDVFRPVASDVKRRYGIEQKKLLVAMATAWSDRKGLSDYMTIAERLPEDIQLMLVGLKRNQVKKLPKRIIGLERTQSTEELVALYAGADIVMNLSYEETFGLTTVEGFACGTPSIVYNSTASPELVTKETGLAVAPGDIDGVLKASATILGEGKNRYKGACRKRAVDCFDKNQRFAEYIQLYNELIGR